jgi:hypothetical protein
VTAPYIHPSASCSHSPLPAALIHPASCPTSPLSAALIHPCQQISFTPASCPHSRQPAALNHPSQLPSFTPASCSHSPLPAAPIHLWCKLLSSASDTKQPLRVSGANLPLASSISDGNCPHLPLAPTVNN